MNPLAATAPGTGGGPPWDDLDDERLVELARQAGGAPAQDELLRRYTASNARLVRRLAARSRLQEADRMDAQQEAVFWTLEAVRQYRSGPGPWARGCRFRSFVYRVVTTRFIDFFRRQRRRERLIGLGTPAAGPPDGTADSSEGPELNDIHTCLERELDRLGPDVTRLWRLLAQGVPLRQAASNLAMSYDMAKRQRRQLLARLRVALAD